jgi:hypothetical protein
VARGCQRGGRLFGNLGGVRAALCSPDSGRSVVMKTFLRASAPLPPGAAAQNAARAVVPAADFSRLDANGFRHTVVCQLVR